MPLLACAAAKGGIGYASPNPGHVRSDPSLPRALQLALQLDETAPSPRPTAGRTAGPVRPGASEHRAPLRAVAKRTSAARVALYVHVSLADAS